MLYLLLTKFYLHYSKMKEMVILLSPPFN